MAKHKLRHFIDLIDVPSADLRSIIASARAMKKSKGGTRAKRPLASQTLAMIFDKPSTRTRISFEVAMRQLGGDVVMLTGAEMQLGRGESIPDTARVMSRFVDAVMIRTLEHDLITQMAEYATVPVINGLTRRSHPCQVMADVMTFEEHLGTIKNKTVAWTGDANNVLTSWMHAAERFEFRLNVATPPELAPQKGYWTGSRPPAPQFRSAPIPKKRSRAPIASSPIPGCRWATKRQRPTGTTFCSPIRSTPG